MHYDHTTTKCNALSKRQHVHEGEACEEIWVISIEQTIAL
jgi:hypothetical protein